MKILYFGGQKSGKSKLAEKKAIEIANPNRPYYIATYNNSYGDLEMQKRIEKHRLQRRNKFITIEEMFALNRVIESKNTYLIECVSMWILNMLNRDIKYLLKEIELIAKKDANIIFVLNSVNEGVIPIDKESRKYIDYTGIVGQKIASICDEVYEIKFGIEINLKKKPL